MGELTNLRWLDLDENALSGQLPRELTQIPLFVVHLPDSVCVPRGAPFDAWVDQVGRDSSILRCGTEPSSHLPAADRAVLGAFYRATDGDNWYDNSGWLSALRIGRWYGVETGEHGRVTHLSLDNNGLTGVIPPELGQLEELRWLSLFRNFFLEGPLPPELGQLSNLTELDVSDNQSSGSIPPEWRQLTNLEVLLLHTNQLSGPLPPEWGQLTNLEVLWLRTNPLLAGPVPDTFLSLTALTRFDIRETGVCVPTGPEFDTWLNSRSLNPHQPRCLP